MLLQLLVTFLLNFLDTLPVSIANDQCTLAAYYQTPRHLSHRGSPLYLYGSMGHGTPHCTILHTYTASKNNQCTKIWSKTKATVQKLCKSVLGA